MSSDQWRDDVVRYWWSKGEQSLSAAEREINADSLEFAMNRVYYAAFYAVSAALLERRVSLTCSVPRITCQTSSVDFYTQIDFGRDKNILTKMFQ